MSYTNYDPRAAERLEALRFQALTNRAIANALNRKATTADNRANTLAAVVLAGFGVLASVAQLLMYCAQ